MARVYDIRRTGLWAAAGALAGVAVVALPGCVLAPPGTKQEAQRARDVGNVYERPVEQRKLPDVASPATWTDVLQRAFLANGDLEASYFEWQASLAQIDTAATWPNSNLQIGFERMFSRERMKAWDQTTISAGFDPATSLLLPNKVAKRGQAALENARATGNKFLAAKFELQRKVLTSYLDLALTGEKVRIQRDNVGLLKLIADSAAARVQAGGPQQDLLKAQVAWHLAENELNNLVAEANGMRAMLNGMLARTGDAPLTVPQDLPAPRPVAGDDARLIAVAVDRNPGLATLANQVAGRKDALELARMEYLPDINPLASITGDVSKSVGAMVMLPTALPAIRGMVNEARAMLRSTEAMARQARSDRAAGFVANLYAMRNAERQERMFRDTVLPAARQVLESSRQAYSSGTGSFIDLIDSQRTLLEVRQMIAEARVEREKRLAELEAIAGVDIETLGRATTAPVAVTLTPAVTTQTSN